MPQRSRRCRTATLAAALTLIITDGALNSAPVASAAGGDPVWGAPVVENFDQFDPERWFPYSRSSDPSVRPRRDPALVSVGGGVLVLAGSVDRSGGEVGSAVGDHLNQKYGRWEVRFQLDTGAGYGGAVLLWPRDRCRWPQDGEIDLIEVHSRGRVDGINAIHNGVGDLGRKVNKVHGNFTTWHTAAVNWTPHQLTYFLDGRPTWTVKDATSIPSTCNLRLALQLDECAPSIYRGYIPCRDASSPPVVRMRVDWVKVSRYLGDAISPVGPKRVRPPLARSRATAG